MASADRPRDGLNQSAHFLHGGGVPDASASADKASQGTAENAAVELQMVLCDVPTGFCGTHRFPLPADVWHFACLLPVSTQQNREPA